MSRDPEADQIRGYSKLKTLTLKVLAIRTLGTYTAP
jgi:hypothetical protein